MKKDIKNQPSVKARREWIENVKKINIQHIGKYSLDEKRASSRHCENMIGVTQIPLGIAGPLLLKPTTYPASAGPRMRRGNPLPTTHYIPLATTEGALVASVNRGCKAIAASGGVSVYAEEVGTTRGPVFKTASLKEGFTFKKWLDDHIKDLREEAQKTSQYLKLKKIGTRILGKYVYVRFYFTTGEAMGMNMATIATTAICQYIQKNTSIACISVAGNFDIDKKPAWLNFISGRGKRVWAEATIPQSVLKDVLKTDAKSVHEVWLAKNMIGSAMSGSLGFNAHFANIVAALFLSTGQDIAHVVEGSMGLTSTEINEHEDLYISIYMPALMVGTVGGGTALETQKESLSILGIGTQKGSSMELAKVLGGTVLAGELSLLAALSKGTLAKAHEKLARGK